jgi:hypothetical protein
MDNQDGNGETGSRLSTHGQSEFLSTRRVVMFSPVLRLFCSIMSLLLHRWGVSGNIQSRSVNYAHRTLGEFEMNLFLRRTKQCLRLWIN